MTVQPKVWNISLMMVAIGFLAMGCTHIYDVPKQPVVFPAADKVNMTVELRLTDALCNATWEKRGMSDTFILPIGTPLCMNSEAVARSVFTDVIVTKDTAASRTTNADALLIPSFVALERDRPATLGSLQTTSILFNWSLNDPNGLPIWVTTISGDGKGPMRHPMFKDAAYEQTEKALQDVFQKSFREMTSSPLIREFAANLHK